MNPNYNVVEGIIYFIFFGIDPSFSNNSNSKISSHCHYQNYTSENLNENTSNQILRVNSTKKKKDEKFQNNFNRISLSLNSSKEKVIRRNSNISDYYPRQAINKKQNPRSKDKAKSITMEDNVSTEKKKENNKISSQVSRSNTRDTMVRPKTVQSNLQSNCAVNQNKAQNLREMQINEIKNNQLVDGKEEYNLESNFIIEKEIPMTNYTFSRIIDWLKEIENCPKIYKTPSELDSSSNFFENERSKQITNEWDISEYGSLDDQIIEYNRVVDKTFHIIHKD